MTREVEIPVKRATGMGTSMPARRWESGETRTVTVEEDVQVLEISLKDGPTPPPPQPVEERKWADVLRPEAVFEARADATAVATEGLEGLSLRPGIQGRPSGCRYMSETGRPSLLTGRRESGNGRRLCRRCSCADKRGADERRERGDGCG